MTTDTTTTDAQIERRRPHSDTEQMLEAIQAHNGTIAAMHAARTRVAPADDRCATARAQDASVRNLTHIMRACQCPLRRDAAGVRIGSTLAV